MTSPFQTETLLRHVRALADDIGHRAPTSPEEERAADYTAAELHRLGVPDIRRQSFQSGGRLSYKTVPGFLLVAAGLLIGLRRGRFWQVVGGLLAVVGGLNLPSVWRLRPMPWEALFPLGVSQNLIARLPANGERHKKIVLLAHLDTSTHRISATPALVPFFPWIVDGTVVNGVANGLLSIAGTLAPFRLLGGLGMVAGVGVLIADELNGGITGANDNASGVAVSLAIAEHLRLQGLAQTEVWFVYTGCEQAGAVGARALLEKVGTAFSDALFINLKMVGRGEICWATHEGVGVFAGYKPRYGLIPIAERAAAARPELGVMGKPMAMIDDLSAVMDWGFSGITITGYTRETGSAPDTHQRDDVSSRIEPTTLHHAAQFVLEMITQIDSNEGTTA